LIDRNIWFTLFYSILLKSPD